MLQGSKVCAHPPKTARPRTLARPWANRISGLARRRRRGRRRRSLGGIALLEAVHAAAGVHDLLLLDAVPLHLEEKIAGPDTGQMCP